ncbi:hypothetical protein PHYPSEUDO_008158 [Phytophthora pseudosyringae]|uniref:RxLR effector protein n=1 Tax=Phytophthora pseudosyringae TaxID=221518 RepID=A0A8T1WDR1_9STRA|nr:hypothetical protein PHYPSEUDO_008158 [Phytophthora pseudosyringae]
MAAKLLAAFVMLASLATAEMQAHGHIRGGNSMALVLSESAQEGAADASRQDTPPEFVPTYEWQDILPNQAIPPGLYIRVNLETGKKEAKLLE